MNILLMHGSIKLYKGCNLFHIWFKELVPMMEKQKGCDIFSPERVVLEDEKNGQKYRNEEEKRKIGLMRIIIEKHDPSYKEIDDLTLRRFLLIRNLDVGKASASFIKYTEWRPIFVPKGYISAEEVPNEIAQNKVFIQGTDRKGFPILLFFPAKHIPRKGGIEELKKFVVFALDKLCSRIPDEQGKFIGIADFKGYRFSNNDVPAFLAMLAILQNYYPERLGKFFLINVPYMFHTVWKLVYPFINKYTKKKIIFVEDNKLQATLNENIDDSQLPVIYGGDLQLVPIQDA